MEKNAIKNRCFWCQNAPDFYIAYHDQEWGLPISTDQALFELLSLEAFQAGLSWLTILKRREGFREAFAHFDIQTVANFDAQKIATLVADPNIIRHRGKIEATIHNAQRALALQAEYGSLAAYLWSFEVDTTQRPAYLTENFVRTLTVSPEAHALSRDLKKRGWKFVGPTTLYAFLQAAGLVNDHQSDCPARARVEAARAAFTPPRLVVK